MHPNTYALIDVPDFERLKRYRWHLRKSGSRTYAIRRITLQGKTYEIKLHRDIMNTPEDQDCHHKNRKTLDCRRSNLENLSKTAHYRRHHASFER